MFFPWPQAHEVITTAPIRPRIVLLRKDDGTAMRMDVLFFSIAVSHCGSDKRALIITTDVPLFAARVHARGVMMIETISTDFALLLLQLVSQRISDRNRDSLLLRCSFIFET